MRPPALDPSNGTATDRGRIRAKIGAFRRVRLAGLPRLCPWFSSKTGGFSGVPGRTRTCDPRFRKPMLYPAELRGLSNLAFISVQFGPLLAQDSGRVAMRHRKHSGERTPCHDASIAWLTLPQTGEPSPLAAPKLCLSTPADHASTSRSHGRRRIHV